MNSNRHIKKFNENKMSAATRRIPDNIEVWDVSNPNLWQIVRRNIMKEILLRHGNLSVDQVTKEGNRSNKQYLYKPKDFCISVRDEIYMQKILGTNQNFMTSRSTKNVSYFNPTCAKSAKTAYMNIFYKTNRPKFLSAISKSGTKVISRSTQ